MFTWQHTPEGLNVLGELDIFTADTLHQVLLRCLNRPKNVIDLRQVERIDTAAAQLLTAACLEAGPGRMELLLSGGLERALTKLGLTRALAPFISSPGRGDA